MRGCYRAAYDMQVTDEGEFPARRRRAHPRGPGEGARSGHRGRSSPHLGLASHHGHGRALHVSLPKCRGLRILGGRRRPLGRQHHQRIRVSSQPSHPAPSQEAVPQHASRGAKQRSSKEPTRPVRLSVDAHPHRSVAVQAFQYRVIPKLIPKLRARIRFSSPAPHKSPRPMARGFIVVQTISRPASRRGMERRQTPCCGTVPPPPRRLGARPLRPRPECFRVSAWACSAASPRCCPASASILLFASLRWCFTDTSSVRTLNQRRLPSRPSSTCGSRTNKSPNPCWRVSHAGPCPRPQAPGHAAPPNACHARQPVRPAVTSPSQRRREPGRLFRRLGQQISIPLRRHGRPGAFRLPDG